MVDHSKNITKLFGKNMRQRRKKLKLTQEALAERVGICHQSLSRMEQGRISPKFDRLQTIAESLHCSVADLFHEESRETDEKLPLSVCIETSAAERRYIELFLENLLKTLKR